MLHQWHDKVYFLASGNFLQDDWTTGMKTSNTPFHHVPYCCFTVLLHVSTVLLLVLWPWCRTWTVRSGTLTVPVRKRENVSFSLQYGGLSVWVSKRMDSSHHKQIYKNIPPMRCFQSLNISHRAERRLSKKLCTYISYSNLTFSGDTPRLRMLEN